MGMHSLGLWGSDKHTHMVQGSISTSLISASCMGVAVQGEERRHNARASIRSIGWLKSDGHDCAAEPKTRAVPGDAGDTQSEDAAT